MNKGIFQIVGGAALFGLIPLFLTWCHSDSVIMIALGRALFASLFTGAIVFFRRESLRITLKQFMHYSVWSLILIGAILLYFLSIQSAGHAIPGVVIGLQPLFVALAARLLFRERITRATWFSFILATLGIVLLANSSETGTVNVQGVLFAMLSAILLGFNFTYHLKFLEDESPSRLVFFQNILQLPILCIALPFIEVHFVKHDIIPFAFLGIICTGLAYLLIYAGSKSVKKQLIGFLQLTENVIPVLTGIFLMHEQWGWTSFFGLMLILSACVWSVRRNFS